ncbi:MAG: CoA pyrophosphatase [SAR86 cluster bacterium]|uniref:CoA pyrophosphatase n=1 Tax=SAR86 cluster bacterium TaxID=2030880 RepID=A0A2A5B0F1_9GAMM|nr:MAG: CoA pyrophosphatase [SAR86 cluster bacterium]
MTDRNPIKDHHIFHDLVNYFSGYDASNLSPIPHPDNSVNNMLVGKETSLRKASVLIPITRHQADNESHIVLTVRSENLNTHAGQISLPGGSRDEQDADDIATALRESEEEIGLATTEVEVIGQLGDMALPSGFQITPVVGLIKPGLKFKPCPFEVAEIFSAPLALVLDLDAYTSTFMTYKNKQRKILELQYKNYRIWGATAAILHNLAREVAASKLSASEDS